MDTALIDIGIGLAVIFLLTATIADVVNELITRTLNTRSKALWATINGLMTARLGTIAENVTVGTAGGWRLTARITLGGEMELPSELTVTERIVVPEGTTLGAGSRLTSTGGTVSSPTDQIETVFEPGGAIGAGSKLPQGTELPQGTVLPVRTVVPGGTEGPYGMVDPGGAPFQPKPEQEDLPEIGARFLWNGFASLFKKDLDSRPRRGASTHESNLLDTPSIQSLDYVRSSSRRTKVWHIPGNIFASAILELSNAQATGKGVTKQVSDVVDRYQGTLLGEYLSRSTVAAAEEVDQWASEVGDWFDSQMVRLSAAYKRNVKYALAAIGFIAAFAFNINALQIAATLNEDANLREAVALAGDQLALGEFPECKAAAESGEITDDELLDCAAEQVAALRELNIPLLGDWTVDAWQDAWGPGIDSWIWLQHLIGLSITAGAVSFGGVFWWDFLRWLTGVRRTVKGGSATAA